MSEKPPWKRVKTLPGTPRLNLFDDAKGEEAEDLDEEELELVLAALGGPPEVPLPPLPSNDDSTNNAPTVVHNLTELASLAEETVADPPSPQAEQWERPKISTQRFSIPHLMKDLEEELEDEGPADLSEEPPQRDTPRPPSIPRITSTQAKPPPRPTPEARQKNHFAPVVQENKNDRVNRKDGGESAITRMLPTEELPTSNAAPAPHAPEAPTRSNTPLYVALGVLGILQIVVLFFVLNTSSRLDILQDKVTQLEATPVQVMAAPAVTSPTTQLKTTPPSPSVEPPVQGESTETTPPPAPIKPVTPPEPAALALSSATLLQVQQVLLSTTAVGAAQFRLPSSDSALATADPTTAPGPETDVQQPPPPSGEVLDKKALVYAVRQEVGTLSKTCNTFKRKSLRLFHKRTSKPTKFWKKPTQKRAQPHGAKVVEFKEQLTLEANRVHAFIDSNVSDAIDDNCLKNLHGAVNQIMSRCFDTGKTKRISWHTQIGRVSCNIK